MTTPIEGLQPVELKRSNPINIDAKGKKLVKVKISDIDDYNMKFLDLQKIHNELVKEHNSVLDDMEKLKKSNDDIKHDFDLIVNLNMNRMDQLFEMIRKLSSSLEFQKLDKDVLITCKKCNTWHNPNCQFLSE